MSTYSARDTGNKTDHFDGSSTPRRTTTETKTALKTSELVVFILTVIGVLIAAQVVDGFDAARAWLYVTIASAGYMVSRGLAKSGSYERDFDSRH
jgi:hypothetical protein